MRHVMQFLINNAPMLDEIIHAIGHVFGVCIGG